MALIKSANAPFSVQPFSIRDIETHARLIIQKAQQQAEALLAAAMTEAEQLKRQGKAEGLAAGKAEGTAQGIEQGKAIGRQQAFDEQKAQLSHLVGALTTTVAEVDAKRHDLQSEATADVIRLAAAIARKATKKLAAFDDTVLTDNLAGALRLVISSADIRLAIHPEQKKSLEDALPALKLQWPRLQHVELIEDATIGLGGCRIFTRQGLIDADLDGQIDRIVSDLLPHITKPVDEASA